MKNTLLIILSFISSIAFGQFNYNSEGLTPKYTVIEFTTKSQSELYQATINWIKDTYKNPNEVIKSTIDNNKVRFEGVRPNSLCSKALGSTTCQDAKYSIEIEFKEGRLRFVPYELQAYYKPTNVAFAATGWTPIDLNNGSFYYNKKGELKKVTELQVPVFYGIFNELASNLKDYIEKGKDNTSNSDW